MHEGANVFGEVEPYIAGAKRRECPTPARSSGRSGILRSRLEHRSRSGRRNLDSLSGPGLDCANLPSFSTREAAKLDSCSQWTERFAPVEGWGHVARSTRQLPGVP